MRAVVLYGTHSERPELYADVVASRMGCKRVVFASDDSVLAPGVLMVSNEAPASGLDVIALSVDEAKWRFELGDIEFLSRETVGITPAQ